MTILTAFASRRFVLSWWCLLLAIHATAESVMSPIQNLEASLAASMAQSTTIAVKSNDSCVVLAYQSSNNRASKLLAKPLLIKSFEKSGLALCSSPDSSFSTLLSRLRFLTPLCFCTMTGFAADVSHLMNVLAKIAESHQAVYSEHLPLAKCVRSLSSILQRAARLDGGRPYGIQSLMIGLDSNHGSGRGFQIYSCDPTGLYRYFSSGKAVIGRQAESIGKELSMSSPDDAISALSVCLQAIVKASKDDNFATQIKDGSHAWEALLLWKSAAGDCEVGRIDSEFLSNRFREILEQQDSTTI